MILPNLDENRPGVLEKMSFENMNRCRMKAGSQTDRSQLYKAFSLDDRVILTNQV